jgi:phosphate transport system substrate-binding protein
MKQKTKKLKTILELLVFIMASFQLTGEAETKLIKVDGSSTVYPITEAVVEEFQKQFKGVKGLVGISGTGGGFKRFCKGETDISDASRPIKSKEVDLCKSEGIKYIELPVAYDGLAVLVNPKNTWVDYLTTEELKKIWEPDAQGKITKWSQIRNSFPDKEIHLFGPGTDSGTFDYFTEAICGGSGKSRGDYTASEDDNVLVQGIASDESALGYFGLAYYEQNKDKLKLVSIDDKNDKNGKGAIKPTLETVKNGTYQPLARPIFIYVSTKATQTKEVVDFVEYYLKNSKKLVVEVGYIPLADESYTAALDRFQKRITGSVFGKKGVKTIGVKMTDLLRMEK